MVQASKKNEVDIHKNELKNTRNEVLVKREPKKEVVMKEVTARKLPKKEVASKEVLRKELSRKELTKEEIRKEEIPKEEASEKMTLNKRKPSLQITFHNPNSDEIMTSYLIKVLGERLAKEIRKGPCT